MSFYAKLFAQCNSCKSCELHSKRTKSVVTSKGPDTAPIMLLGEGPGLVEEAMSEPFLGPAGKILHDLLDWIKLDPSQIYFTNSVKCRYTAPPNSGKQNLTPNDDHIKACSQWLHQEIAHVNPKLIIACGATALKALSIQGSITNISGSRKICLINGRSYDTFILRHPASLIYAKSNPGYEQVKQRYLDDLLKLRDAIRIKGI